MSNSKEDDILSDSRGISDHARAARFWRNCHNSYLAAPEYYDRQEVAILELLRAVEPCEAALDIGCGDGRFTVLLRGRARRVTGIDVATALVCQAKIASEKRSLEGVEYFVESIERFDSIRKFGLVTMMGVTSGLIDNLVFHEALVSVTRFLQPGGFFIVKDTTVSGTEVINRTDDYLAKYRNTSQYLSAFEDIGFKEVKMLTLSESPAGVLNAIRLMKFAQSV